MNMYHTVNAWHFMQSSLLLPSFMAMEVFSQSAFQYSKYVTYSVQRPLFSLFLSISYCTSPNLPQVFSYQYQVWPNQSMEFLFLSTFKHCWSRMAIQATSLLGYFRNGKRMITDNFLTFLILHQMLFQLNLQIY